MNPALNTLIVDDEPLARERLARLLQRQSTPVAGEAANGLEALKLIDTIKPAVVLLDVQMPVMDGFETARHISRLDQPPAIVFCTAYDQYALDAFDAAAVDYLVKPVKPERLAQAYEKLQRYQPGRVEQFSTDRHRAHLCARMGGNIELIAVESIHYCRAEHKYVTVVHADGESLIEDSLIALEQEFEAYFVRIHRNTLVARNQIRALEKNSAQQIMLRLKDSDATLEISRRNLPPVRKLLKQL